MKRILLSATAALALVASMIAPNADPYEGARRAQQEYFAQRGAAAMSNPDNCFGQVDYGPPVAHLTPRIAEVYRQNAEQQLAFLNGPFCQDVRHKKAEAEKRQAEQLLAEQREQERKRAEQSKAAEERALAQSMSRNG
jgi:hypothetical protein